MRVAAHIVRGGTWNSLWDTFALLCVAACEGLPSDSPNLIPNLRYKFTSHFVNVGLVWRQQISHTHPDRKRRAGSLGQLRSKFFPQPRDASPKRDEVGSDVRSTRVHCPQLFLRQRKPLEPGITRSGLTGGIESGVWFRPRGGGQRRVPCVGDGVQPLPGVPQSGGLLRMPPMPPAAEVSRAAAGDGAARPAESARYWAAWAFPRSGRRTTRSARSSRAPAGPKTRAARGWAAHPGS